MRKHFSKLWDACYMIAFLFAIGLFVNCAMQQGKRWDIDASGHMVTLTAPDGLHFRDGTEIDKVNLAILQGDPDWALRRTIIGMAVAAILFFVLLRCRRKLIAIQMRLADPVPGRVPTDSQHDANGHSTPRS